MDNSKVVSLPLRSAPGLVYFRIGSRVFPLQFGYPSAQIERSPAKVLPFRKPENFVIRSSRGTRPKGEEP